MYKLRSINYKAGYLMNTSIRGEIVGQNQIARLNNSTKK